MEENVLALSVEGLDGAARGSSIEQRHPFHSLPNIARIDDASDILSFRITGVQSVQRLYPLIALLYGPYGSTIEDVRERRIIEDNSLEEKCKRFDILPNQHSILFHISRNTMTETAMPYISTVHHVDFVWETFCEQSWKTSHEKALVLNRLHNSNIIENKANLAFLQFRASELASSPSKYLETYVALKSCDVSKWCTERWGIVCERRVQSDQDWWVLKAGSGNGGKDIWILTPETYSDVVSEVTSYRDEEYIIQK